MRPFCCPVHTRPFDEWTIPKFREAARRDLEGERVQFEAGRKRTREAALKELEGARAAEADRAALALAEHARELREVGVCTTIELASEGWSKIGYFFYNAYGKTG